MTQGFSFDVIVVGVGAMGAATCHALARRGVRVLGLERFDVPHGMGSSGGQTRLVRLAYYEHPDYVPLLRRAYELWDQLAEEGGVPLLHRTGALYLGRPDGQLVAGSLQAARAHGLAHEVLDAAAVETRFGPFRVPEHFAVMHEPEAGFVLAERAVATFVDHALRHGAEVHGREPVRSWQADRDGVRVVTDRGTYQAGHLVFTAGPWTGALVRQLGIPLTVTRQVVGWVWPRAPERFALGRFPCWAIEDDAPGFQGIYYGFPLMSGVPMEAPGIKLAHHAPGPATHPDAVDRSTTTADEGDFRPALAKYLPDADGPLLSMRVCMYTMSPDQHFVIDRHPVHASVTVGCGFSGHGFKLAPAMGEALADLALHGRSDLPVGFLGRARFAPDAKNDVRNDVKNDARNDPGSAATPAARSAEPSGTADQSSETPRRAPGRGAITAEQFDWHALTARDLDDAYVGERFDAMSILQLFEYRRRVVDVRVKMHIAALIDGRARDPYCSYLGKAFTVADPEAIVRDVQGRSLRYRRSDIIPPGRKVGDIVVIPQNTRVHVTAIQDDLELVHAEGHGWTMRTNLAGEMINETLCLLEAPYISRDPSHWTIGSAKAAMRTAAGYRSTGPRIRQGWFVVLKEYSVDSEPPGQYCRVAYATRDERGYYVEDTLRPTVWTSVANLVPGWANCKGNHAAWRGSTSSKTKGDYIGQIDLVRLIGVDNETGEARTEYIAANTLAPFQALVAAAAAAGHTLRLNSGFRTYGQQEELWNSYRNGKGSKAARPGRSNHQNGLSFDLGTESFTSPLYLWMTENAPRYGFLRTVSREHWHWEYRPEAAAAHGHKMPGVKD
jgi:sarcosine oxidase